LRAIQRNICQARARVRRGESLPEATLPQQPHYVGDAAKDDRPREVSPKMGMQGWKVSPILRARRDKA